MVCRSEAEVFAEVCAWEKGGRERSCVAVMVVVAVVSLVGVGGFRPTRDRSARWTADVAGDRPVWGKVSGEHDLLGCRVEVAVEGWGLVLYTCNEG